MKLQQLQYLSAIVHNDLNVSAAAQHLRTSQSAISKQVRLLEQELGVQVFIRKARQFTALTEAGREIVAGSLAMLREARYIEAAAAEVRGDDSGALSLGTTHTQARYVLPPIISAFMGAHPRVRLHLRQGTVEQIAHMLRSDVIEVALATGSRELFDSSVLLPCYQWHRCVIVPRDHPLAQSSALTLHDLARFPLITYAFSLSGPAALQTSFGRAALKPQIAITAWDADVIKTYVRRRMGVGIVAEMAISAGGDDDLLRLDASHLFGAHVTWIALPRGAVLRSSTYRFLQLCASHLDRATIQRALQCSSQAEVDVLFCDLVLSHLPENPTRSALPEPLVV